MKKALVIISALYFASASQYDGFLSPDNELRIRPISYNPNEEFLSEDLPQEYFKDFPTNFPKLLDVDDEQYARPNMVKNWHYPLPPLPMNNPSVYARIPVQNKPKIEKDSGENPLFQLGEIIQQKPVLKSNMGPDNGESGNSSSGGGLYLPPHHMRAERQHR